MHQMIMGAGKTTVIAPLLVLMLADGESLVYQVCPLALLQHTSGVMRSSFSALLSKRVYTFSFERQGAVSRSVESVRALRDKLERARAEGAVVCSSPESIKSLMLKYVLWRGGCGAGGARAKDERWVGGFVEHSTQSCFLTSIHCAHL